MFQTMASAVAAFVALGICGFAVCRGELSSKIAGGVFLSAWLLTPVARIADPLKVELVVFALDVIVLVVFLVLTLTFKKFWLVWASAFQLLSVATHLAMIIDLRITLNSYVIALGFWSLAVLASILTGAFNRKVIQI